FGPETRDDQLRPSGFLDRVHQLRVLPRVDERAVDRLLVGEDGLDAADDVPAARRNDSRQNRGHAEELRRLRQRDDVIHDELRLVTVQIGELSALMIDQEQRAVFRSEKRVQTGVRRLIGWGRHGSISSFAVGMLVRREGYPPPDARASGEVDRSISAFWHRWSVRLPTPKETKHPSVYSAAAARETRSCRRPVAAARQS